MRSSSSSGWSRAKISSAPSAVVRLDVPNLGPAQELVALVHLVAGPGQDRLGLLHVGDDRVHQVRDPLVLRKLDLLGVDQDHLDLVGALGHEDREDHGVQADRLARPGAAGHQQVGHLGQVEDQGLALDVLAQEERDAALLGSAADAVDHVAQPDDVAVVVGNFDADGRLARDRGHDPHAGHRQGDGQVVGQAHDPRDPQTGLELDLELGDHRAGVDLDDADLVAEIEQGPLQEHGPGMDLGLVLLDRERRRAARAARKGGSSNGEPGRRRRQGGQVGRVREVPRVIGSQSTRTRSAPVAARSRRESPEGGHVRSAASRCPAQDSTPSQSPDSARARQLSSRSARRSVRGLAPPSIGEHGPNFLDRPEEHHIVAERQAEQPGRGRISSMPDGPKWTSRKMARQVPRHSRRCPPPGWAETRHEPVDQPGRNDEDQQQSRAPARAGRGLGRRADQRRLTTASPRSSSQDDQPSVMNRTWANTAPTGPQGLVGAGG